MGGTAMGGMGGMGCMNAGMGSMGGGMGAMGGGMGAMGGGMVPGMGGMGGCMNAGMMGNNMGAPMGMAGMGNMAMGGCGMGGMAAPNPHRGRSLWSPVKAFARSRPRLRGRSHVQDHGRSPWLIGKAELFSKVANLSLEQRQARSL